jgi:hypothetical protein
MKPTRSAAPSDAHGLLTVRGLTDFTERQLFDALLGAEHFLGPGFPAGDRLYQVAEQAGTISGSLVVSAASLGEKARFPMEGRKLEQNFTPKGGST